MARAENLEQTQQDEVTRLGDELEQARVTLEDAQQQIAALVEERDQLLETVATLARTRAAAEKAAELARRQASETAATVANSVNQPDEAAKLRTALEEISVLAEELQAANEELVAANEDLDRRVAERTAAVTYANAELERLNANLGQRVEVETAARAKAQADLFQMQKLEAIGQLTGGIAHDFNNLLMVVINGLEVLASSEDTRRRERALRRTQEASWRAAELTRRLLAFARRQALHPERVDMRQRIVSLQELLAQGLRENVQLLTDVPDDVWPLESDVSALELALLNLTVNARDAMPNGGKLTITARNRTPDAAEASILGLPLGDFVEIAVQDTGVGMHPDVLEKVFEPFFTTKGAGRGTGLGLAQVYGFAQQSGGTAKVESRFGDGTTVRLLLPRSKREAGPEAPLPPQTLAARAVPCGPLRVLVVEDEPSVAAIVVDMLAQLGHRATSVSNVAAALAFLADPEQIDLVLTDVLLPGGSSGLDLAREMRQRHLSLPIILTSGYGGSMTQRLSTMNLPFLRKPYQLDTLNRAIGEACGAGRNADHAGSNRLPTMA